MSEPSPRSNLGQYKLLECISKGPVASVYVGEDRTNGAKVRVRIVNPVASQNPQIRAVLEDLRRPQSDRRLSNPSVLRILDVAEHDNCFYIVYEAFEAVGLDEIIHGERPPLKAAMRIALLIADAVRCIHEQRVVHGDIKPQNILIGKKPDGRPVVKIALADLGRHTDDAMISVFGELVGTPKYLAPERIEGKRPTVESDVFSLGVVFYELFSGEEPFSAENALGYLRANMADEPRPLSEAGESVPEDLSQVVMRMIARDPQVRYRSSVALMDDLERVAARIEGKAATAPRPGSDSVFAAGGGNANAAAWRNVALISLLAAALMVVAVVIMALKSGAASEGGGARGRTVRGEGRSGTETVSQSGIEDAGPLDQTAFEKQRERTRMLIKAGEHDLAIGELQELLAAHSRSPLAPDIRRELGSAMYDKAQALSNAGQVDEAIDLCRKIAKEFADSEYAPLSNDLQANIMMRQVAAHASRAELKEAVALAEKVIKEFPRTGAATNARRQLAQLRMRLAKAMEAVDVETAVNIATGTSTSGLSTESTRTVRKTQAELLMTRADGHLAAGRYEECLKDLGAAQTADPSLAKQIKQKVPEVLAGLALDLKRRGKYAEAIARWRELTTKFPISIWVTRGKAEMAPLMKVADDLGRNTGDDVAILMAMAQSEIGEGNFEAGRSHLETILKDYPRSPQHDEALEILARHEYDTAIELQKSGKMQESFRLMDRICRTYDATKSAQLAAEALAYYEATPEGMVYVAGGSFTMGLSDDLASKVATEESLPASLAARFFALMQPDRTVQVRPYYIDRTEVTNAQYAAFVASTGHAPPLNGEWEGATVKPGCENRPVTSVSWNDAVAYAKWAGKRLPTETEWEYAARGPESQLFPWGNVFDKELCFAHAAAAGRAVDVGGLEAGRSVFGCLDMIGNAREWTQDDFLPYPGGDAEDPLFDGKQRVTRGGAWIDNDLLDLLATSRMGMAPDTTLSSLGFRCVKDVKPAAAR